MLEKDVEGYLVQQCKRRGWLCYKFASPSNRAVPDRVIILPGRVVFVECKAPGKRATPQQQWLHGEMRKRGAAVRVVDGREAVWELMLELEANDAE
jgi:hypothetical protein